MPELAEVEHARRLWDVGLGKKIREVIVPTPRARVFRQTDVKAMIEALTDQPLVASMARGKQMMFRLGADSQLWLAVHLGMSGNLRVEKARHEPARHEHLLLRQAGQTLVFHDPRHFGRVRFDEGEQAPGWWRALPPSILGSHFDAASVIAFLARRRSSLKAVLLMQERFPGIGK
jgi:formamidopyrimidine-DNA glycosylase